MRCQVVLEMLSPYLDGVLDPAEHEAVKEHLTRCPSCNSELVELKNCLDLLQELPEIAPPAEFRAGLMEKINNLPSSKEEPPKLWYQRVTKVTHQSWYRTAAVAAVMVMALGITSLWEQDGKQLLPIEPQNPGVAAVEQQPTGDKPTKPVNNQTNLPAKNDPSTGSQKVGSGTSSPATQKPSNVTKPATVQTATATRNLVLESYQPQPSKGIVVRSALLKVDVAEIDATLKAVGSITQQNGGSVVLPYIDGNGTVGIKVPVSNYQTVIKGLQNLGEVVSYLPTERDLSNQHKQCVDLIEQLKEQRSELEEKLGTTPDPTKETELAQVDAKLNQQVKLAQQIEEQSLYAIINITIS